LSGVALVSCDEVLHMADDDPAIQAEAQRLWDFIRQRAQGLDIPQEEFLSTFGRLVALNPTWPLRDTVEWAIDVCMGLQPMPNGAEQ
jgi:hypothetical protein